MENSTERDAVIASLSELLHQTRVVQILATAPMHTSANIRDAGNGFVEVTLQLQIQAYNLPLLGDDLKQLFESPYITNQALVKAKIASGQLDSLIGALEGRFNALRDAVEEAVAETAVLRELVDQALMKLPNVDADAARAILVSAASANSTRAFEILQAARELVSVKRAEVAEAALAKLDGKRDA